MVAEIRDATEAIRERTHLNPKVGIVLGTGLSGFGSSIADPDIIPYNEIPHFPQSTVDSHPGNLVFGKIGEIPVVAMQGRFHLYEGYSAKEVVFPIRIMARLGVKAIILSNAAGGLNPDYQVGDLVAVCDHINLMPSNPLTGQHFPEFGPRFPDMIKTYDEELIALAMDCAQKQSIKLHRGIYAAVQGPNLETPAEHKFLRIIGSDLVGMSTVPEIIAAKQHSLKILVLSVVTNACLSSTRPEHTTLEEVIRVASKAEPKMRRLVEDILSKINLVST